MIEGLFLCIAIGFVVLLVKSSGRADTDDPDELLGVFAYKRDRSDPDERTFNKGGKSVA